MLRKLDSLESSGLNTWNMRAHLAMCKSVRCKRFG
jgi:hypothetical protein